MYPKIQSQSLAGESNTGSCAAYAYYLQHENKWKKDNGLRKDIIPFYDRNGEQVSIDTVINTIDGNRKGLHVDDTKFFSVVFAPSRKEAAKLGSTREKRIKSLQEMLDEMMDRYAAGFGNERIKDHQDLLYFYTIHEFREDDDGNLEPGIHIHVIVSRKDLTGKFKLSPMTNHRGETSGVIKSGFNRDAFFRDCEKIYDTTFGFQRRIVDTYDYLNTMKHGNEAEKSVMVRAAVKEEGICEKITDALAERAARLAREAASAEAKKQREEELARMDADKKKRNEFWNCYHSYYRPVLKDLNEQCNAAFLLYKEYKEKGYKISDEIEVQYRQLKLINNSIARKRKEMYEAATYKDLVKSLAILLYSVNPIAALLLGFILLIVIDVNKRENWADIQALRKQADSIRSGIDDLRDEQGKLKYAQNDTLRQYIQVKDEKAELNAKIKELRKELEPKKETIDLEKLTKELNERKKATKEPSLGQVFNAFGVYGALMAAESKLDLDLDLLTTNTILEPVFHPNGGVADISIISDNVKTLASNTYSNEKLTTMLEKWEELTGQKPAHRVKPDSGKERTKAQIKQVNRTTNGFKLKI